MSLNTIFPNSVRDTYTENDIVDFLISIENQQVLKNSMTITGTVEVVDSNDNRIDTSKDVNIDAVDGVHALFQGITSSCDRAGVIENNIIYPLWYRMKMNASQLDTMMASETNKTSALRSGENSKTKFLLLGNNGADSDSGTGKRMSFAMKPDIAFNKSNDDIRVSKTGNLQLSLRMATNRQFLFGNNASSYSYKVRDLQLHYYTRPLQGKGENLVFESIYSVKNTAESNNTSLSTRVPAVVRSVSCAFIQTKALDNFVYNNIQQERPPDVQRVNFSFNDSTTAYVSFTFENQSEILYNYQRSLGYGYGGYLGKSNMTQHHIWGKGDMYGIGLNFGQLVDMRNSKFGLNIVSGIGSAAAPEKYSVFMVFRGVVSV